MSPKSFIIILVLSVVVTYGAAVVDALIRSSLLAGSAGLPFKFASGSLFGGASTNYALLLFNIIFWFFVLWILWKGYQRVTSK